MITPDQLGPFQSALACLQSGFASLPAADPPAMTMEDVQALEAVARRLQSENPYQHPLYVGQMLQPPHPVSHLAYTLAMCLNPNNHALDGGRMTSGMEVECIRQLEAMVGWSQCLGHLCGGGTLANFEALWVAREVADRPGVAASSQAHYTHQRLCGVLQVPFHAIQVDRQGRMDLMCLEEQLRAGAIGTVVATLGTTGLGAVDPLHELIPLQERYGFRLHVDAAYGGYFRLAENLRSETRQAFAAMSLVDSIVIDPHKRGLQPYGCGCVLFRDPAVAKVYRHDSPYTYFTPGDLHLGEISLECSRSGAAAAALWATLQAFPLVPQGRFARLLESSRMAALEFTRWLHQHPDWVPVIDPELDIVNWIVASESASESSRLAQQMFDAAARQGVHLALLTVPQCLAQACGAVADWDQETVRCLRATVMKAEHQAWMPEIISRLEAAAAAL